MRFYFIILVILLSFLRAAEAQPLTPTPITIAYSEGTGANFYGCQKNYQINTQLQHSQIQKITTKFTHKKLTPDKATIYPATPDSNFPINVLKIFDRAGEHKLTVTLKSVNGVTHKAVDLFECFIAYFPVYPTCKFDGEISTKYYAETFGSYKLRKVKLIVKQVRGANAITRFTEQIPVSQDENPKAKIFERTFGLNMPPAQIEPGTYFLRIKAKATDNKSWQKRTENILCPLKPNAVDDVAITNTNTLIVIDVLNNDQDYEGQGTGTSWEVQTAAMPAHGTLNWDATQRRFRYMPDANYSGADQFIYQILAKNLADTDDVFLDTAVVNITVLGSTSTQTPLPSLTHTPNYSPTGMASLTATWTSTSPITLTETLETPSATAVLTEEVKIDL